MNCSQCQAANGPDTVYCVNCGTPLAPAAASAGASGYGAAPGTPPGYQAEGAPAGYPAGYGAPGGYNPPPAGYGPPGGQAPTGYPQGQHAQGQHAQGQYQPGGSGPYTPRPSGMPPVSFDPNRLTTVDKTVGIATLITMISLWLPWYTGHYSVLGVNSSGTISGTGDHGWLWIEFIIALALVVYLAARAAWDQLPFKLPVAHTTLLIAGTGLQFLLILIGFFALPSTGGIQGLSVSWDFGSFLALIASIVAAAPVIYPAAKSYLDGRKGAGPATY
jgi:hypothetical protein